MSRFLQGREAGGLVRLRTRLTEASRIAIFWNNLCTLGAWMSRNWRNSGLNPHILRCQSRRSCMYSWESLTSELCLVVSIKLGDNIGEILVLICMLTAQRPPHSQDWSQILRCRAWVWRQQPPVLSLSLAVPRLTCHNITIHYISLLNHQLGDNYITLLEGQTDTIMKTFLCK